MDTVQLSRQDLLSIYNAGNDEVKKLLEDKCGSENFQLKIEDRIQNVYAACVENGTTWAEELPFKEPKNQEQRCVNAFASMIQIVKAFNQGKTKDWKNSNQYKYYPWWRMDGASGSGLSFIGPIYCGSSATIASRLCLLEESHVEIVAKRFQPIYQLLMTE